MKKKLLYQRYGTTKPDMEFHNVWNEDKQTYELFSVREIIDTVNKMLKNITAHKKANRVDSNYQKLMKGEKVEIYG